MKVLLLVEDYFEVANADEIQIQTWNPLSTQLSLSMEAQSA